MNRPTISIITVSYNSKNVIEETILSVINQTYEKIEYIIIDGGSTDGTIDIIKKYENQITHWISEPDFGIYDAMNKGIGLANGNWVNFMNCGDTFASTTCIENNIKYFKEDYLVVYSDCFLYYSNKNKIQYKKTLPIEFIKRNMIFCHQSTFINNPKTNNLYFNLNYKICADYDMFLRIYLESGDKVFNYAKNPFSIYEVENGFSKKTEKLYYKERIKIHLKNKLYISFLMDLLYFVKNIINR